MLPTREDPHFRLRIPADLRKRLTDAATDNSRSANAEIVSRLSHSFRDDDRLTRLETKLDLVLQRMEGKEPVIYPLLDKDGFGIMGDQP